jgi:hypothetical protein
MSDSASKWFNIGKYAALMAVKFLNFESPTTKIKLETFWDNNEERKYEFIEKWKTI